MLLSQLSKVLEAGTDEAGRGALAGPVCAAAVILPLKFSNPILNDSKKLTEKQRYQLREIIEKQAITFAMAFVSPKEIDKINILKASIKAMHLALKKLNPQPKKIIVDGNKFIPYKKIPFKCIIKGDQKFQNIAAASILAKTYRDDKMKKLHREYPIYNWDKNKGYPTKYHRLMLRENDISPYHRKSFKIQPSPQNKNYSSS